MGPTAQIDERAGRINADFTDTGTHEIRVVEIGYRRGTPRLEVVKQFDFEVLRHLAEHVAGGINRHLRTLEAKVLFHLLPHLLLDGGQVIGCEWPAQMDVVIKPVFHHRPDAEPGFREDFQNTRGHDVRKRVTLRLELLVLRHTAILRMFLSEVERRFYLKRETRTAAPTTVAMVVIKAIISVKKMKLGRLSE